jgi:hypothetical protein
MKYDMGYDDIIIVAGGPSVFPQQVADLTARGIVIAVNGAALNIAYHLALTMDRLFAEKAFPTLVANSRPFLVRRGADKNLPNNPCVQRFECDHTSTQMSDDIARFNGTHSGLCALNVAYQLRPRAVYLFGYDMGRTKEGAAYWHKPHAWAPGGGTKDGKYREWARQLDDEVAPQFDKAGISVYNLSAYSALRAWPKITFADFLQRTQCNQSE